MQVATKVGNLPSKFGHDRPLDSRIIRNVRDGWTDKRNDGQKQRLLPLPYGRGIINSDNDVDDDDNDYDDDGWLVCV